MTLAKRSLSLLLIVVLCFGLVALTARFQTKEAEAATTTIINGDFSYGMSSVYPCSNCYWMYLDLNNLKFVAGQNNCPIHTQPHTWLALPSSFNAAQFGWRSSQAYDSSLKWSNGVVSCVANCVELQREPNGNHYAELTADQRGTYIYQDISTVPGAIYKWSLKHASRSREAVDSMSVMIGSPSSQTAQSATRTSTNGLGNKIGSVGTVISTPSSNSYEANATQLSAQWESYSGTYIVPEGQTTTRFTFKATASMRENAGNLVDDITFTRSFALNYDLTGGSSSEIYSDAKANGYAGYRSEGSSVVLTPTKPTRAGYSFLGWSRNRISDITTKAGYDAAVSNLTKGFTMSSASTTVYAVWAKNPTVSFVDVDNTTIKTQVVTFGSGASEPNLPQRIGYSFSGWSQPFSAVYSDLVVAAKWQPHSYQIRFDPNGANGTMENQSFVYGTPQSLSPLKFERSGYLFAGWNTNPEGGGQAFSNMQEVRDLSINDGDTIALYAQWIPIRYNISFEANGGQGAMSEQSLLFDEEQTLAPNSFDRPGFDWLNWNTHPRLSAQSYSNSEKVINLSETANDIVTLYAIWAAHRYLVSFEPNGGTGHMEAQSFSYDLSESLFPNAFEREGYRWISWNTLPDGSGATFSDEERVRNLTDQDNAVISLYAQWEPDHDAASEPPNNIPEENFPIVSNEQQPATSLLPIDSSEEGLDPDFEDALVGFSRIELATQCDNEASIESSASSDSPPVKTLRTSSSFDKTGGEVTTIVCIALIMVIGGAILLFRANRRRKRELERKRKIYRSILKL